MTYQDEICRALIRVLERAVFHKDPIRLAGYATNIDYWAGEIRHALDGLEGYESRFRKLEEARIAAAKRLHRELDPAYLAPSMSRDEIGRLRDRLLAASTRFMRLCAPEEKAEELELLLGIRIKDRRPNFD